MRRIEQLKTDDSAPSPEGRRVDLLGEWIAHLRQRRASLREEGARRMREANVLPALGRPHWLAMPGPFRPASRRTAPASGLCYPNRNFQTRSQTLVTLGVDLTTVHAVGDFQGGIEEAEQLLGHKVDKMGQHAAGGGEYHASSNSQTT